MGKSILMITERFAPDLGGVAVSARKIAEYFCELDMQVHVFSWTKSLPAGQLETKRVSTKTGKEILVYRLGLFGNLDFSLQFSFNIFEWLFETHSIDLVWGHYLFPAGFVGVSVAELNGKPSIVSARGNDIDRLMFPPGDFARLQWTLERASCITAVSQELARKTDMILGGKKPIRVLANVVDVNLFKPSYSQSNSGNCETELTSPVLGFCGELRQKKGLPILLETFDRLNQSHSARLMIIGGIRTRENNELSDFLADRPHLVDQITVTGNLNSPEKVCEQINQCDIMLCPSLWDGVPNSILESMACEKLVIASDAGGIPDIINHSENGYLVSKHLLAKFSAAVQEVLDLPKHEKERVRANARRFCVELWDSKKHLSVLEQIISDLLPEQSKD